MTTSVAFAAISNPIKFLDGLYPSYPTETFFAHLSARVTFQHGAQLLDIQS